MASWVTSRQVPDPQSLTAMMGRGVLIPGRSVSKHVFDGNVFHLIAASGSGRVAACNIHFSTDLFRETIMTYILLVLSCLSNSGNSDYSDLRSALTFHVSFDGKYDADFAKGDKRFYTASSSKRTDIKPGNDRKDITFIEDGRFGKAIRFGDKAKKVVFYKVKDNFAYREKNWSGTVSFWLRLDPQKDLKPGYADPIQITDKAWNDSSFFVDYTKDDNPRHVRLGAFSDLKFWNPKNINWDDIPNADRPLVTEKNPPFSREQWTHVAFAFSDFNNEEKAGKASFYLNGILIGSISRDQKYSWSLDNGAIMLGLSYIGDFDDLAIFNRALSNEEIQILYSLPNGVGSIR